MVDEVVVFSPSCCFLLLVDKSLRLNIASGRCS